MKLRSSISLLLALLTVFGLLCSCGEAAGTEQTKVETETRSDEPSETQIETVAPETEKPEAKTEAPAQTTEATAQTTELIAADTSAAMVYDLSLEWYLGYVGSSTHSSFKNKLNKSGGMYSYSQIVRFPNAGTKISFVDDNTNSNGDTNYASASAYVFSSWKENNGVWEIDLSGYNVSGTEANYTDKGGARTYTYTTKKANECLRFGYRSGQSTSFAPAKFPLIHVEGGAMPEKITETEAKIVLEGTATTVKWIGGYVGSDTNAYNYQYKLYPGASGYAYTDVIEVAKAGTKLSFIDTHNGSTSSNAFVVFAWTKVSGEWQIDRDGFNVSGSPSAVVSKNDNGTLYSYTTSKDGECIRFCYRSDGNETTNPPVIYVVENAGKGTLQMMNEAAEDLAAYLKNDLAKLDNSSLFAGKTMFVIGDSYFAGNGLEPEYVWPSLLAKKIRNDLRKLRSKRLGSLDLRHEQEPDGHKIHKYEVRQPRHRDYRGRKERLQRQRSSRNRRFN